MKEIRWKERLTDVIIAYCMELFTFANGEFRGIKVSSHIMEIEFVKRRGCTRQFLNFTFQLYVWLRTFCAVTVSFFFFFFFFKKIGHSRGSIVGNPVYRTTNETLAQRFFSIPHLPYCLVMKISLRRESCIILLKRSSKITVFRR